MKKNLRKPGEFLKLKAKFRNRQKVYDGCKRARAGEADVYVTLNRYRGTHYQPELVRVKLAPVDPKKAEWADYAFEYGTAAIIMVHGEPMLFDLSGKDGLVYGPTGTMDTLLFLKQALAFVSSDDDIHSRSVQ